MSYIVRQKIKGRIYLYEATSYWDKDKKQNRQKRKYLGREDTVNSGNLDHASALNNKIRVKNHQLSNKIDPHNLLSFAYGDIKLLIEMCKRLGIIALLKSHYPDHYQDILLIACYNICKSSPFYLFHYWQMEHNIFNDNNKKLYSSTISSLCNEIGKMEISHNNFTNDWVNKYVKPENGIYYDIIANQIKLATFLIPNNHYNNCLLF